MIDFAFLGHPADFDHLADLLRRVRPGLTRDRLDAHRASVSRAFEWTPPFAAPEPLSVPGANGPLSGRLVVCTFLPESIASPRGMMTAYNKTRDGVRLARELGARIVGLGGFTSIVGGTQGEALGREFGVATTSGNALTAALALEQLMALLERLGQRLNDRSVAVLGASGDIGRACTLALAPGVKGMLLFARNRSKLEALRGELPAGAGARLGTDAREASRADIVIAATSSARPLLAEADLRPGAIVCDIGYPKSLSPAPIPRPDVIVFSGGLAQAPFSLNITHHTRLPAPDVLHGCFAETIVLAMAGRDECGSAGPGRVTEDRMGEMRALAGAHGFHPAPLYRGGTPITEDALEDYLRSAFEKCRDE